MTTSQKCMLAGMVIISPHVDRPVAIGLAIFFFVAGLMLKDK